MARVALATVLCGCASKRITYDDAIVHTDRIGYHDAYGQNPSVARRRALVEPIQVSSILPPGSVLIDLTHTFDARTIVWPGEKSGFVLERGHRGTTNGGWWYEANRISLPEHGGTHIDAPSHFAEGRTTVDKIALPRLLAPALVLDISERASTDPDALLEPEDIAAFEARHGKIVPGSVVLVRTGWSSRWPDRARYLGDPAGERVRNLHFPGISETAARELVAREVGAVGIDTASLDHGPSQDFAAHRVFARADVPAFENVARLDLVPERGAMVIALPMKIGDGSGGPLRIVAVVPR